MIRFLFLLELLVITVLSQCPPGLTPLFSNNNNQPLTCTPQDSCSCYSGSSRFGTLCQYASTYNNYICCYSTNTQCGTNSSPQISASGQVVSCSMNTNCASGYTCNNGVCCPNTNSNSCSNSGNNGCLTGQVLVNGQCYNSVNIGSACQRTEQCTGGSQCQNAICQCQSGFVNVNQQCVVSNGLNCQLGTVSYQSQCISLASPGQNCVTSSQCIDNSICNNAVCTCNSNYQLVYGYCVPFTTGNCQNTQTLVNNQCVLYSIVGETCIANQQCVGGAICNSGTCRCQSGATAMYGYCISSSSTSCNSNQVSINGICYPTVQIGGSCSFSQQCLNNAVCTNSVCVSSFCNIQCNSNQVGDGNELSSLQLFIDLLSRCASLTNAIIMCPSGHSVLVHSSVYRILNVQMVFVSVHKELRFPMEYVHPITITMDISYNGQCYNTVSIGSQCMITQQCLGNSQCINSFCQCPSGSTNVNGFCQGSNINCNSNQISYNGQCYNTVSIGSQCIITQQCLGNSQCLNAFCQCPSGSTNVNGFCQGSNINCNSNQISYNGQCYNTVSIGSQCVITQQCLGNSQCLNSFCQCASGSSNVNGFCQGSNGQCGVNQVSSSSIFSKPSTFQVLYNGQCYSTVSIGNRCTITQQCLGNSQCLNSICQCPTGSNNVNGFCQSSIIEYFELSNIISTYVLQVSFNGQCYNTVSIGSQCVITQQCLGNSQCVNSFCQCPTGTSNVNGFCTTTSNANLCSAGQTVQLDNTNQPINCLVSTCPTNSFCQYSSSGQRYVCCRSTTGKKK
ncbi:CRE-PQN-25 protein [Caenorhabditis remanei]|uniref:CRE-PQN-25 protein n=1 Tax=Caenorhabditis remanei TaxID=31234 RepID=E3LZ23_CAERE|nr:CRE-PQN-25 protein [Caenorhabditis remanei]